MLLVAFGALGLAVYLAIRGSAKPVVSVVLLIVAVGLGAGSLALGGSPQARSSLSGAGLGLTIASPGQGDVVRAGDGVPLKVDLKGGRLTTETSSSDPKAGHLHVYVDSRLVSMPSTDAPTVKLKPGRHVIAVEFVDAGHVSYAPRVLDEVRVRAR